MRFTIVVHSVNNWICDGGRRTDLSVAWRSVVEARRVTDKGDCADDDCDVGHEESVRLVLVAWQFNHVQSKLTSQHFHQSFELLPTLAGVNALSGTDAVERRTFTEWAGDATHDRSVVPEAARRVAVTWRRHSNSLYRRITVGTKQLLLYTVFNSIISNDRYDRTYERTTRFNSRLSVDYETDGELTTIKANLSDFHLD